MWVKLLQQINVGFVLGPLEVIVDVSSFEKTEQIKNTVGLVYLPSLWHWRSGLLLI